MQMKHEVSQVRLMMVEMEWICWTQISKLIKCGYTGTQMAFIAEKMGISQETMCSDPDG